MAIDPQGPVCSCGTTGCFEAIASGNALGAAGRRLAAEQPDSPLGKRNAQSPLDAPAIVAAAREGDAAALDLLAREARWLGLGFCNLAISTARRPLSWGRCLAGLRYPVSGIRTTLETNALPPFRDVAILPSGSATMPASPAPLCSFGSAAPAQQSNPQTKFYARQF